MTAARPAIVPFILMGLLLPSTAQAGSRQTPPFQCAQYYVCNAPLGVALRTPATWRLLPAGKEDHCTLSFARRAVSHLNYDVRLTAKLVLVANATNDRRITRAYANTLVQRDHAKLVRVSNATYGGAPAVVIRGLPLGPRPTVYVVISHTALVYLFAAPGRALDVNQRQAIGSLRFLPRQGAQCP